MIPFSIVDSEALFDFLHSYKIVQNRSEMHCRKTVSTTALLDICESFEVGIKRFFAMCEPQSIATTYDMWTDGHGHHNYINLSVHFIDKQWNLQVVNLGTDPLERPHTAVRIEHHIEEKLIKFGLGGMVNISEKDDGSNVMACARNMTAKTGLLPAQFDDFKCMAHKMHLLLTKDS